MRRDLGIVNVLQARISLLIVEEEIHGINATIAEILNQGNSRENRLSHKETTVAESRRSSLRT
jgi:hypothetical protein